MNQCRDSVGKHPKVCNTMTGIYNKKPPRYCFAWDIEAVLRYLNSLPTNKLLSTKLLTLKSKMLLALTSASRCSGIRHLDIRFYTKNFVLIGLSQPKQAKQTNLYQCLKVFKMITIFVFLRH